MNHDLFDRELEAREIARMLEPDTPRTIAVLGDSGVGKSVLVDSCLKSASLRTINFSFKSKEGSEAPSLTEFIVKLNEEYRQSFFGRFTSLKLKDVKLSLPMIGSITFEIMPEAIDGNYCEYVFEHLYRAGYRVMRIENIELCRNAADVSTLNVLSKLILPRLKIVFEIGTLDTINHELQHIVEEQGHREILRVSRLDEQKTMGLHRFLHGSEPPPDLFEKTNGLPLAVEHNSSIENADFEMNWINSRLDKIDKESRTVAYILSNVDEPCAASDLERMYDGPDFYPSLLSLINARVCEEDESGVKFKHPSFRLALRRRSSPSLDRHILTKTLEHREKISDGSLNFLTSIVSVARKLGDRRAITIHGLNGLIKAYQIRDALKIIYFCDALLDKGNLSDRQNRIIRMVEIQSLNQLMRSDEAASKLDQAVDLLSSDARVAVLQAMTLCQHNEKIASNEIIDQNLVNLDPRSAVIALAIRIANDVPLEMEDRARTSFEDALAMAKLHGFIDLEEELVRLNAKLVSPPELAIERMRDHLSVPPAMEVGRARLVHNLGVQEMLISNGRYGIERLQEARGVFARHGLSFVAYSAVSLSVGEVARGQIDQAREILVDAQCLCREQYDLFGVMNNLSACFLLLDENDKALESLERAKAVLNRSTIPLVDSVLDSCLHQNMALAFLKIGRYDAAEAVIGKVKTPRFARCVTEREARLHAIKSAISLKNHDIELENTEYDESSWMYTRFLPNLTTLSFYDYPFYVIPEDELSSLISSRH